MKLKRRFKYILLLTLSTMYVSGLITWIMTHWFLIDSGFGNEPSPFRLFWLQMHSVIGLWYLILFGYMFHAHVRPSWKKGRRIKTGVALTSVLIILCATVDRKSTRL